MSNKRKSQLNLVLNYLLENLDVPEGLKNHAISKYNCLTNWLKRDCTERFRTDTLLYYQGSMRLGTIILPIRSDDDIDIDVVYRRDLSKLNVTQEKLMETVGEQLINYIEYLKRNAEEVPHLERGKRCWTLIYNKFHMDILPAIPDSDSSEKESPYSEHAILITDKELKNWQFSNPRGYWMWFDEKQKRILAERRSLKALESNVDVEEILPETIPTPLRQAIKLLKRHRDIRYKGNPDDKPISIIITTLAARVYDDEITVYDTLVSLVQRMKTKIEIRNGEYWIPNPVNENENFADRWAKNQHPERAERFFEWLQVLETELSQMLQIIGLNTLNEVLNSMFGKELTAKAFVRYGENIRSQRELGNLRMENESGILGATGAIKVANHTFFGEPYENSENY